MLGEEMGYPGIVLDEDGGQIEGFVFLSENLVKHWQMLDAFEGEGYQRILTEAKLK